jgi:hypothetical protein
MRGPVNPWNSVLAQRAVALSRAYRHPITPGCDLPDPTSTPVQRRKSLLSVPINTSAAGDNQLISTLIGTKLIYEIVLWNVTAQNLALYQGPSATGILLLSLPSFPATTGLTLGFNGNFEQPHFEIDPGQAFVLNLQNATQVTGFIRYRVATEAF